MTQFDQSSACHRKATFQSKRAARDAMTQLRRKVLHFDGELGKENCRRLDVYHCRWCGQWHVGKRPQKTT